MLFTRRWCGLVAAVAAGLAGVGARGQTCPGEWVQSFPGGDLGGKVAALVEYRGEPLVAGPVWATAEPGVASFIVRQGDRWAQWPAALDGSVKDMRVSRDRLYVAGSFELPDGRQAHVAFWDGTAWTPLLADDPFEDATRLAVAGDVVIASGPSAGPDPPWQVVGRWTGARWERLGDGFYDELTAVGTFGDRVFVGGSFVPDEPPFVHFFAEWDGEQWQQVNAAENLLPRAMIEHDGKFIVGGSGLSAGVYEYDGAEWRLLGPTNGVVYGLSSVDGNLIAAGDFSSIDGKTIHGVALWDGAEWSGFGTGIDRQVCAVGVWNGTIVAGGSFDADGERTRALNSIAQWDGRAWQPFDSLGTGPNGWVHDLVVHDGRLIALGAFTAAGDRTAMNSAAWDGREWTPLHFQYPHGELAADVLSRCGRLQAVGWFFNTEINAHVPLAEWNGTEWALATSVVGTGRDAADFRGDLVIAGQSLRPAEGGPETGSLIRGDGDAWEIIRTGGTVFIRRLHVYNDELIATGSFQSIGGVAARNIARWNGERWAPLAEGLLWPFERDMTTYRGELIVTSLKRWNGVSWSPIAVLPPGFLYPSSVDSLTVHDGLLYVGGHFYGNYPSWGRGVAAWDGTSWHVVGAGVDVSGGSVNTLAVFDPGDGRGPQLFAGGSFNFAGGFSSRNLAQWAGCTCPGDFTGDRSVDSTDLNILLSRYGDEVATAYEAPDLTGDRLVDAQDLNLLLARFGEQCPPPF